MIFLKRTGRKHLRLGALAAALWVALSAGLVRASAYGQTALPDVVKPTLSINLGSTSFYDGFGRLQPGLTVLEYFRWSHNTAISDSNGIENALFTAPRINSFPSLTQIIVATKWRPFGGAVGFSVLVPLAGLQADFAANSPQRLSANGLGLGDMIAGPAYQSKSFFHHSSLAAPLRVKSAPAKGGGPGSQSEPGPFLAWRAQVLVQIPIGAFNPRISLNQGSGYWAVVPYLAATYLPQPRMELSARLHYQYNLPTTKIANPPPIPLVIYNNGQAGQLVYANFAASYRITRAFYFGANSYGVYQLSPDKTNGVNVGKARETQLYLGPGVGYDFSRSEALHVSLYLKLEAHNTASGPSLQLLYIHRF